MEMPRGSPDHQQMQPEMRLDTGKILPEMQLDSRTTEDNSLMGTPGKLVATQEGAAVEVHVHAPVKGDVHMLELMIQLDGHAEGESLKGRIDPRPLSFDVRHPPTYGVHLTVTRTRDALYGTVVSDQVDKHYLVTGDLSGAATTICSMPQSDSTAPRAGTFLGSPARPDKDKGVDPDALRVGHYSYRHTRPGGSTLLKISPEIISGLQVHHRQGVDARPLADDGRGASYFLSTGARHGDRRGLQAPHYYARPVTGSSLMCYLSTVRCVTLTGRQRRPPKTQSRAVQSVIRCPCVGGP